MNIKAELRFNDRKPAVLAIRRTGKGNITAIGLRKGQALKEHKTSHVTTLIVVQGEIHFIIGEKMHELREMDIFEAPCDIYHKVVAPKESIFVLVQDKA